MKRILAFSGSFSKDSINHKLASYAASSISNCEVEVIRLSEFEAPLYTKELETEEGVPETIKNLRTIFDAVDGFIVSVPEYNSSLAAGFKNTMDWLSRMEGKIFQDKPVLLMATSPGGRGGQSVLSHLSSILPFWGAVVFGPFSLPKFNENFTDAGLEQPYASQLQELIREFEQAVTGS